MNSVCFHCGHELDSEDKLRDLQAVIAKMRELIEKSEPHNWPHAKWVLEQIDDSTIES